MTPEPVGWQELLALDRERVWHPYGGLPASPPPAPLPVVSAAGVRLRLADGRELIDGMASWWCAIHGYRHPALDAAVREQLERMAHVMFGGLTHEPAIRLVERLVQIAPAGLARVFLADSGSVSVEVAIKLALQYQRACARPERTRLLALRGAYHGDTFGAMAVCDPVGGMHSLFTGALVQHVFAPRPPGGFDAGLDEHWASEVRELAGAHAHELAAVIAEPVVQGAGGMWIYAPECLSVLRSVCDEHGLLLILDEIATGFGRTGALFACEHPGTADPDTAYPGTAHPDTAASAAANGVLPDIMCVGKALTGGCMTLAATMCTPAVAEAVSGGEGGGLMHGPTFMANPLACAVALASLELLGIGGGGVADGRGYVDGRGCADEDQDRACRCEGRADGGEGWREDVARIERGLLAGLVPARELPGVVDVRVLGAIGVIQLDRRVDIPAATAAAVKRGVWLRPFRDLIYAMPPYVIGEDDLAAVAEAMVAAAGACGLPTPA